MLACDIDVTALTHHAEVPTILIVDDEVDLAETIAHAVEREGWTPLLAHDGTRALEVAQRQPAPDAIVLDLMLPDIQGIEVCRRLRAGAETRGTPILMLTARDDEVDRIVGFEVGADDYVSKPFSLRELMLRIKAVMRRIEGPVGEQLLIFGRLRVNKAAHQVWVDDKEILLTALEFRLLATLLSRRGRVQSRETLLGDVWGHDPGLPTRTVDTHVQRLRKKLGAASAYIETLRGTGYRFRTSTGQG